MKNSIHHLGTGWEPQVHETEGKFIYSIPVESGSVSRDFEYEISQKDLEVLKTDTYRYAVLYHALHTLLQNTFGQGVKNKTFTTNDFQQVVNKVLYSSEADVKNFIKKFNSENHITLEVFVEQYLKSKNR